MAVSYGLNVFPQGTDWTPGETYILTTRRDEHSYKNGPTDPPHVDISGGLDGHGLLVNLWDWYASNGSHFSVPSYKLVQEYVQDGGTYTDQDHYDTYAHWNATLTVRVPTGWWHGPLYAISQNSAYSVNVLLMPIELWYPLEANGDGPFPPETTTMGLQVLAGNDYKSFDFYCGKSGLNGMPMVGHVVDYRTCDVANLTPGHYQWYVKGYDKDGVLLNTSDVGDFSIIIPAPPPGTGTLPNVPPRPEPYDPGKVWDPETRTWVATAGSAGYQKSVIGITLKGKVFIAREG